MPSETIDTVRQGKGKKMPSASTQLYLRFSEIRDDTVVLKNGGLRAILKTSSVNFNLKSEEEQNALMYGYQAFLNTLEFPIQIVVRSKKLDIDEYLDKLKKIAEKQENKLLQKQTSDYVEFISRLVEFADIMEKEFYVVVPYDPFRTQKVSLWQRVLQRLRPKDSYTEMKRRHEEFATLKKGLTQRINIVKAGLENVGLKVELSTTPELIELFYYMYNPVVSRGEKVKNIDQLDLENNES